MTTTPIHLAQSYATIANDGKKVAASLLKSKQPADKAEQKQVISKLTARSLRLALSSAAKKSGAKARSSINSFEVAGKVGTTLKRTEGGYSAREFICSYVGMLPASDPELVCYVMIDTPTTKDVKHNGNTIAAPVFKQIMNGAIEYLEIKPVMDK